MAKTLSSGRPTTLGRIKYGNSIPSSQQTRTVIRSYHALSKAHANAIRSGDQALATRIQKEIEAQGGLTSYQAASSAGQSSQRGGDSSKTLMEWLSSVTPNIGTGNLRMLEVGALSTSNACSRSGLFHVARIDLYSQEEGILQQNFMERPLPASDEERFDCVSLSLVLNYVPDPVMRGEMLKRTTKFLRRPPVKDTEREDSSGAFPCIFLVLPAPCVTNSRYLDDHRLEVIMGELGYKCIQQKQSEKLVYSLWRKLAEPPQTYKPVKKIGLRSGQRRNNFAIVLR
ncbi:MAG: hypothetical protein M1831_001934 [Alyxoria varia]|nr:MAG: hypothetical protein M1831_001934 [Alyxoria varia]